MVTFERSNLVKEMITPLFVFQIISTFIITMIQKEYNELVLQEISIEAENYDGEIIKVNESIFFITEEAKETVLDFSLGNSQLNK